MTDRQKYAVLAAALGFVVSIWLANWLVDHVGAIRVWPTDLLAPAGVYVIGLAFLLRDTVQRFLGQVVALELVLAGTALSAAVVNAHLALASAAAFAASEVVGLALFWISGGNVGGPPRLGLAVVASSAAAAALDSFVFLSLAPTLIPGVDNVSAFFEGQFVAKLSVVVLALPFVLMARRRWPARKLAVAEAV